MLPRTQRQKEILDYISRFIERHGYEPSYAQIARHFGVKSKATIAKHIGALERRGLLSRQHVDGSFGLAIKVEETSLDALCEIPLLGQIAAGAPIDTGLEDAEQISVPRFLLGRVRPERVYALRVKGDSMIDEHICDGDIALIENRTEARDGEIVVALPFRPAGGIASRQFATRSHPFARRTRHRAGHLSRPPAPDQLKVRAAPLQILLEAISK